MCKELIDEIYEEYKLYGGTPPHQKHSRTSKQAAKKIKPRVSDLKRRILQMFLIRRDKGYTDAELLEVFRGYNQNTIRPRRIELASTEMAMLTDSGRSRLTKSSKRKCYAVVWVITERGKNYLKERGE